MEHAVPIVETRNALGTRMPMGCFDKTPHGPFVVRAHDLQDLFGSTTVAIHRSDKVKASAAELQLKLFKTELRDLQPGEEVAVNFVHKFSAPGTYVLRVTANDGQMFTSHDVTVTVK